MNVIYNVFPAISVGMVKNLIVVDIFKIKYNGDVLTL